VVFDDTNPRVHEVEGGKDEFASFKPAEDFSNTSTETITEEPATVEVESTTPANKVNIPRGWKHNASYPENFILGKSNDKIFTQKTSIFGSHIPNVTQTN